MKGRATRARIFRAALRLASRDGLLTLTLDKVAEEAGLSKGGVMHHFASKEALLRGVMTFFSEQIEGRLLRLVAEDPKPSFRWLRAMLALTRPGEEPGGEAGESGPPELAASASPGEDLASPEELERFMLSVLAAAVHNPDLTEPIRSIGQRLRGRLTAVPEEGIESLVLWLVMDGLFLWQFVGLIQRDDPLIGELRGWMEDRERELSAGLKSGRSYARRAHSEFRRRSKTGGARTLHEIDKTHGESGGVPDFEKVKKRPDSKSRSRAKPKKTGRSHEIEG